MQNKKDYLLVFGSTTISFVVAVLCFLSPLIDGNNYVLCGLVILIGAIINLFRYLFINNKKASLILDILNLNHGLGASVILLLMILTPNDLVSSLLMLFILLGIELLNKGFISIYFLIKKNKKLMYGELILLTIIIHLLMDAILIVLKTETNGIPILIIGIVINVFVTIYITGRPIIDIVDLYIEENTKFKDKIVYIFRTLNKYKVFFYLGLSFTLGLAISTLIAGFKADESLKSSYWSLFIFYFSILILRIVAFVVHTKNEKKYVDNQIELKRKDYKLLLIICITLIILGDAFGGALSLIVKKNAESTTLLWWYLAIILPFAIIRLIISINTRKEARRNDNPYLYVTSTIGFIATIYSFIGVIATSYSIIKSDWIVLLVVLLIIGSAVLQTIILITQLVKSINGVRKNKEIKEN